MRLMMKGDMAFFYHSNCKVPGIAGTMEIVQEHSVDGKLHVLLHTLLETPFSSTIPRCFQGPTKFPNASQRTLSLKHPNIIPESAFDPEHPYHDPKSDRSKPKWCLVHVEFRKKFPNIVKLKELQKYAKDGGVLEHMQTLKQTRLSVSKVTKTEWDFIMGLVDSE